MTSDDRRSASFNADAFERADAEFSELARRLPQEAVMVLAREVVARLARTSRAANAPLDDDRVEDFCTALLAPDREAGKSWITRQIRAGQQMDEIYTEVLSAAARRLGTQWENDELSFAEVTVGASRIYAIMRAIRPMLRDPGQITTRSALFALVPGETHTLGVSMAADLFRKEGWEIDLQVGLSHDDMVDYLQAGDFTVIGLSASTDRVIAELARLIVAIRLSNPTAYVMVGGKLVELEPDLIAKVGADFTARDVPHALAQLKDLVAPDAANDG